MVDRRVVVALVILVASIPVFGAFLFVYQPPATVGDDPNLRTDPPDGSFAVTETLTTDGEEFINRTIRYDATTGRYLSVVRWPNVTVHAFVADGRTHVRVESALEERFRDRVEDVDGRILRIDNRSLTMVYVENGTDERQLERPGPLFASVLGLVPYDRVGTDTYHGRSVAVYRPIQGWIDRNGDPGAAGDRYRITNASGALYADDRRLRYANVSFTATPADTWGTYYISRDQSAVTGLDYRFHRINGTVPTPEWVPDERSG